jgi:hypothetical protein
LSKKGERGSTCHTLSVFPHDVSVPEQGSRHGETASRNTNHMGLADQKSTTGWLPLSSTASMRISRTHDVVGGLQNGVQVTKCSQLQVSPCALLRRWLRWSLNRGLAASGNRGVYPRRVWLSRALKVAGQSSLRNPAVHPEVQCATHAQPSSLLLKVAGLAAAGLLGQFVYGPAVNLSALSASMINENVKHNSEST